MIAPHAAPLIGHEIIAIGSAPKHRAQRMDEQEDIGEGDFIENVARKE